jgi:hypothetical protein
VPELSDEELDALVEEATVDAYGDDEQLGGVPWVGPLTDQPSSPTIGCHDSEPDEP